MGSPVQFAGLGVVGYILFVVVAARFTVCHSERTVEQMPVVLIGQAGFGIEEMVVHRQRQVFHVFVVNTVTVVAHIAILQVCVERECLLRTVNHPPVHLCVGVGIHLVGVVAVVLVVHGQRTAIDTVLNIVQSAVVRPYVVVGSHYLCVERLGHILGRHDRPEEVVVEEFAVHAVRLFTFSPLPS